MFKRNAQQVRLCKKVYKLASDLEKNKLLDEKKLYKQSEDQKQNQKKAMVNTIENYYQDKISMLKDRIHREKFERQIA
jgi:CII-binding regulator of phage lambda lysogenization HflD